jgi:hypothetical protein
VCQLAGRSTVASWVTRANYALIRKVLQGLEKVEREERGNPTHNADGSKFTPIAVYALQKVPPVR